MILDQRADPDEDPDIFDEIPDDPPPEPEPSEKAEEEPKPTEDAEQVPDDESLSLGNYSLTNSVSARTVASGSTGMVQTYIATPPPVINVPAPAEIAAACKIFTSLGISVPPKEDLHQRTSQLKKLATTRVEMQARHPQAQKPSWSQVAQQAPSQAPPPTPAPNLNSQPSTANTTETTSTPRPAPNIIEFTAFLQNLTQPEYVADMQAQFLNLPPSQQADSARKLPFDPYSPLTNSTSTSRTDNPAGNSDSTAGGRKASGQGS